MSNKTRFIISIIAAILLVTNCVISFNNHYDLKWLWLVVALSSVFNCFYFYKRKRNQIN
ncbi:hypothetical protein LG329_16280 [Virgibacillus necropolis]|uniref:hypothetical protein n=1 Tax=Virgibacillus necropolis TaxID=163877 RepID=UPI00385162FD